MSTDASFSDGPARNQASVTAHPWFPGIVALWFAALLGLSSLALAPALLERIVVASGIDTLVAAAAPPLGQTARLLLALGLAGLGAMLGLLLGRRLAAPSAVAAPRRRDIARVAADKEVSEPRTGVRDRLARLTGQGDGPRDFDDLPRLRARDRHPDAPGRRPLSPAEVMAFDADDDAEAVVETVDSALRRRAFSSEAEYAPAPFAGPVPVPGDGWTAPGPFAAPAPHRDAVEATDEPLELDMPFDPEFQAAPEPAPFAAPAATIGEPPAPIALPVALVVPEPLAEPLNPQAIAEAPLDSLGVVQLTERLAIAMRTRRERDALRAEVEALRAEVEALRAVEPPIVLPSLVAVRTPEPETAPEREPEPEPVAMVPEPAPARFAVPTVPLEMPHSFRTPLAFDDEDEEDEAIPGLARSLSLAPSAEPDEPVDAPLPDDAMARGLEILARRSGQPVEPQPESEPDEAELDAEALEDGYSSLLNLSRQPAHNAAHNGAIRHEAVRIEEPESDEIEPVVVFPGQAGATARTLPGPFSAPRAANGSAPPPPFAAQDAPEPGPSSARDPAETDRALKAALASLQRISGTR